MKVSLQQSVSESEKEKQRVERSRTAQGNGVVAAGQAAFAAIGDRQLDGIPGAGGEKGKSLIELQQEAADADVAVERDFMTVMSHTMSEEDYAKMKEEGFDPGSMDPEEVVTIVDRIKAELAKAGKNIVGYTDDLDIETLTAALGSQTLARAVADSFRAQDVPLSKENLDAVSQAWAMSSSLQPMGEGACSYMIDNDMEAEIWNLYLAQSSGAGRGTSAPRYYAEDVHGYYAQNAGTVQGAGRSQASAPVRGAGQGAGRGQASAPARGTGQGTVAKGAGRGSRTQEASQSAAQPGGELLKQIDGIIRQAGQEVDEKSRQNAQWLLEKGLPVTAQNLKRLQELQSLELPVTVERFGEAAAAAVAEGKSPLHASLSGEKTNLYEKAASISEYYHSSELWEAYVGDITARRQLEEIRLRMTAEVNVKLLKRGFAIDTAPMEELIEALKQAEHQLADQYFPRDAAAIDKYHNYRSVNTVADQLPGLPADMLGLFAKGQGNTSLEEFHNEGRVLQETYEKAQKTYETLMTTPRSDLGDSIEKAFTNIDEILKDLGMETSEENRRAARILGYNSMEMTVSNLEAVRDADRLVQSVIAKLTPAATLKMIRDGINPLEKSFQELENYFENLPPEYKKEADSYSRFLYGLERNKEITPEERESYIGIYRLVRQIERAEGAVAGALVNAQADIHFSNLLSALQNNKAKPVDLRVVDKSGSVGGLPQKEKSISQQISKAFGVSPNPHLPGVSGFVVTDKELPVQEETAPAEPESAAADSGEGAAPAPESITVESPQELVKVAREIITEASTSETVEKEYNKVQLEEQRQAVSVADQECVAMLQRGALPSSADNLMASQALIQGQENFFEAGDRYRKGEGKDRKEGSDRAKEVDSTELWQKLEDMDEFARSYEELAKESLDAVEDATFAEADSSLDVRHMQLSHKQLTIAAALADREEFYLPMYVGDTLARIHLTLDRNSPEKGTVTLGITISQEEHIQARLYLDRGTVHGMVFGEGKIDLMKVEEPADTFKKEAGDIWNVGSITVIPSQTRMPELIKSGEHVKTDNAELYRVAKVFLQSVRGFMSAS